MANQIILCVDDEKIVLESLRGELEGKFSAPYALEFAESGDEALEVIEDLVAEGDELALIVTDYIMPGLKGDEVLAQVREKYPDARQIMLTGQANLEGITNAINNARLYRYISKPWERNDLLLTIQEALKSREQELQLRDYQQHLEDTVKLRTRELEEALVNLKESQAQLVVSEKMAVLGGLVAGVAHEINTPVGIGVTAISHLDSRLQEVTQLYRDDELTQEQYETFLSDATEGSQIILRNLRTAAELIQNFKLVAVDQSSEAIRSFDLKEYIGTVLSSLQPELKQHQVSVEVDCPEDIVLTGHPGDISQILTNLIMNSIMHGFEQGAIAGAISIEVKREKDEVAIRYTDNGKGIPSNIIHKIFDPFFTTKRQAGRSGLGMHIVYNIITQKLKGSISCLDTQSKGVRFDIRLPLTVERKA